MRQLQAIQIWMLYFFPLSLFLGNGVIEVVISLIAIIFLIESIIQKEFTLYKQSFFIAMLALWVYMIARSLFTDNITESLSRSLPFIRFPMFALAIQNLFQIRKALLENFVKVLIITLTFTSVNMIMQYILGYNIFGIGYIDVGGYYIRLTTLHGKMIPGFLTASVSFPAIYFVIDRLVKNKNSIRLKFGYFLFLIINFLAVLLSGERMAFLVMLSGYLLIFITLARMHIKFVLKIGLLLIFIIALISTKFPQILSRQVIQIQTEITNFTNTSYFKAYNLGFRVAEENIIFGVGSKNFRYVCEDITNTPCSTHPHNVYLEILAESGLIGLFIFILFIMTLVRKIIYNFRSTILQPVIYGANINFMIKIIPIISSGTIYIAWAQAPFWLMVAIISVVLKSRN